MTKEEAAQALHGNQYGKDGSLELFKEMKASRLVAIFGASDDLMEFRGAINNELDAYEGTTAYITANGLLENDCENDRCPHFAKLKASSVAIDALWCDEEDASWSYATSIPHTVFNIIEDDEIYCRGIVIDLNDVE